MKPAFVFVLGLMLAFLPSCAPRQGISRRNTNLLGEPVIYPAGMDAALSNSISQIHVGMSFKEISEIIPILTNGLRLVEHGGIWFNSPAGTNRIVMLRLEAPSKQPDMLKRKLNLTPVIRARVPNEASW